MQVWPIPYKAPPVHFFYLNLFILIGEEINILNAQDGALG